MGKVNVTVQAQETIREALNEDDMENIEVVEEEVENEDDLELPPPPDMSLAEEDTSYVPASPVSWSYPYPYAIRVPQVL